MEIMKITGITAEYNPLHNGHIYQMEQARILSGCDAVAVAMSGDYVQRGEPAILDKWTRCRLALEAGADLVVEIPVLFCLGNASQYASASVRILEALGCDSVAFGSECGDAELLTDVAAFLDSHRDELEDRISQLAKEGISYPSARTEAYKSLRSGVSEDILVREMSVLSDPNDILALEYIRSLRSARPVCVKRIGAGHGESFDGSRGFQSAGAIRNGLRSTDDPEMNTRFVPEYTSKTLEKEKLTFPDEWMTILRYAAMVTPADVIEDCPSGGEGLGNLIKQYAAEAESWEDMVKAVKSKRYTYTRISRLCMQLILGISRRKYSAQEPQYIRVLGFSEKGRSVLSERKNSEGDILPVITNINKEARRLNAEAENMLALDVKAADVYNLLTGRGSEYSDHVRRPEIK